MSDPRTVYYRRWLFLLSLPILSGLLPAQVTTINVNNNVIQSTVRRFGVNLGNQTFYDSGQMMKNLIFINPGFEGEIFQSTIRCGSGTTFSCMDDNPYSGWPTNFWNGATYEFVYGGALGRTGTVNSYAAANGFTGGQFGFSGSGVTPNTGDYMIVKRPVPGNAGAGWWLETTGAGSITTNFSDLPPGTLGKQTAVLTAPTAADMAEASSFFDSTIGYTFLQLNGQYRLTFKAKGLSGTKSIALGLTRENAGLTYLNQTVNLTDSWANYTFNFNGFENGTAQGRVQLFFRTIGQDSFLLDDVSLVQLNGDPTNTTVFRDPVVNALRTLRPGVLRFWFNQLGESLDNFISEPFARQRSSYSAYHPTTSFVSYSLTEFLQLSELLGAEPWIVVPMTFSNVEASNLIDYLAGGTNTVYGAKRAAQGHPSPWTSSFAKIHLELGNEAWNSDFKGGSIEYPDAYGGRAQGMFGAMRANGAYVASSFDLVLGGQGVSLGRNQGIQGSCNNNDSFSIAPYMMYNVFAFENEEQLYGTTFAEAEAFVTNSGTAEGIDNGLILRNQQALQSTSHPTPLVTSEMNLSPSQGPITQSVLDSYATSVGSGIAVIDSMLQQLRAGVLTQNLYQLAQHRHLRGDGKLVNLWGSVVDMGVTDRKRPQFLAMQLANQGIGSSTAMLQTVHTGSDPTWTQFLLNTVQLNNAHYLQSFAFSGGGRYSIIVFNVHRDFSLPVNFAGANVPSGNVQIDQLTSSYIGNTNEMANLVVPTSNNVSNFNPSATLNLPPYSMTVLTWSTSGQPAPQITAVASSAIATTSATITWNTDQPSSTQVLYGTTSSYGSQSPLAGALVTSHSVTLNGLTPGTTYNYAAFSANAGGLPTTSGNFTFTTAAAPAPVVSAVTASAITSTSATITWTTDQPSSTQVLYGTTTAYGSQTTLNGALVTAHSATLSGLTPGTVYNYAVVSANSAGTANTPTNFTFTTATPPPTVSAVTATNITSTSATITWTTNQASSSQVLYGTTTAYGSQTPVDSALVTAHSVTLTGLTPSTTYNYAVLSANSGGTANTPSNFTFATTAAPPPVVSAVAVSNITPTSATISWTTDQASSTQVQYGTTTSYGSTSALNSALVTSHTATLTGLSPSTTYNYAVLSANSAGTLNVPSNFTFATTAPAPPVVSAVTSSGITTTSVTITWTTDQPASSQVQYGTTTAYGTPSALSSVLVTAHSVTLTGLTPATTYNYKVVSTSSAGATNVPTNFTFVTATPPPAVSAVTATNITTTSATIAWTTDQPSSTQVLYGTTTAYGSQSALNSALVTAHTVTLTGLTPGTTYNYAVVSANSAGTANTPSNFTFATLTPPPTVSAVTASGITTTTATIAWTTDQTSSTQVLYGTTTAYGSQSAVNPALVTAHSVTLTGLTPGTTYNYTVLSLNSAGTSNNPSNFTFTTLTPPPVVSAVTATAIAYNSATITWTTDQTSSTQVQYGTTTAYGSQSALNSALVTSHTVVLTGLNPSTTYNYAVLSMNGAGVTNTPSNFTFSTVAAPPPVVSGVTVTGLSANSATINWTTDQASTTRVSYGTTTAYGSQSALNSALVTAHSVTLTGLTASTTYNYAVLSANAAGTSNVPTNFTFTTTAVPAPVISSVATWPVEFTTATILWSTDQNTTSVLNYGKTPAYGSTAINNTLSLYHAIPLTGLTQGTTYHFSIVSTNAAGVSTTSPNYTFTTPGIAPPVGPVISGVTATGITSTSATINWTTDQASTTLVTYGATPAYGTQSAFDAALLTSHTVTLTGLTPGTTYNYAVISANSAGSPTTSSNFTFTTTAAAAPVITAVTSTGLTATTATITWTTDQPSSTQVSYGPTTAYGSQSPLVGALVTLHSITLTGLTPSTTYNYAVLSTNGSGATATSGNFTFATTTSTTPAPVISSVAAWPVDFTTATILWTTDQNTTSRVRYGTTTAYGSQSALNSNLSIYHAVPLSGLTQGTTYHFAVESTNASGTTTTSPDFVFTTSGTPALVFTGVTASGITATGATITWNTNQASTTQVVYGTTTAYGSQSAFNAAMVTAHSVSLTGLTPGTTYQYAALSTNSGAPSGASANFSFTTAAGSPGPVISAVGASGITTTSATITWTTDQASTSRVSYGTTLAYGSQSPLDSALLTAHSMTLTGLTPGTTYNYTVTSANGSGTPTTSGNFTFATVAAPPGPAISAVAATGITTTSATITWTTDQASTTRVAYGTTTAYGTQSPLDSTLLTAHSVTLTGLTPGTTYNYAVTSANGSGTSTTSGNFTFATTAGPGPAISAVTATGITSTSATITWTTDQASTTRVAYGLTTSYGTQSPLDSALVTAHSVTLTGLTPGTTYNYAATSANGAGTSTTSGNFTFATTAAPAGPTISAVTATGITNTSATITWTTNAAATTRVAYGTTTAYGAQSPLDSALVTAHSVTLTGLNPGTTYNYAVTSANSAGTSTTSGNFTFATTGSATPAPAISSVAAWPVGDTTATILWATDQSASSQVKYGTTSALGSLTALDSNLSPYHAVPLTGLTPGTTYHYAVVSTNAGGASTQSATFTFTTTGTAPPPGPVISAVTATAITSNGATISWTTSQPASSQVSFGLTPAYGSVSTLNTLLVTSHTVTLSGLAPGTTYHYAALSTNGTGVAATSGNFTFATTGSVQGPTLSGVVSWGIGGSGATVSWATDQPSDTALEYGLTAALGLTSPVQPALTNSHGVTLSGLQGNTTYHYRARSTNAGGGTGYSAIQTFKTLDVSGPVVSNVVATPAAGNSATVSWTVSKPSTCQVEYGPTLGYGWWSPQTTALQTALGWVPSGQINFRIHCVDASGNASVSANYTFTEP